MELVQQLTDFATKLDEESLTSFASRVDTVTQSFMKVAQYLGSQGYWVRNSRCWGNCYRQKRASSPSTPAQKIWFDCQKEYEASINEDSSSWDKYAGSEGIVKTAYTKSLDAKFSKIAVSLEAPDMGEAASALVASAADAYYKELTHAADELLAIGEVIEPYDPNLARTANNIADTMLKEALDWGKLSNYSGVYADKATEAMQKEAQFNGTRALWNNTVGNKGVGGWLGNKFKNIKQDYKANKTKQYQDWLAKNPPTQEVPAGGLQSGGNTATTGTTPPAQPTGGLQGGGNTATTGPTPASPTAPGSPATTPPASSAAKAPQKPAASPTQSVDLSPAGLRKMTPAQIKNTINILNMENARRQQSANSPNGDLSNMNFASPTQAQSAPQYSQSYVQGHQGFTPGKGWKVPAGATASSNKTVLFKLS